LVIGPNANTVPLWFKVNGASGECERDLYPEVTFTSGAMDSVHRAPVITDATEASTTVVNGSAIIALKRGSYTAGSTIYFRVEKESVTLAPSEMASFTATFHL
jgi:hypothetical protein